MTDVGAPLPPLPDRLEPESLRDLEQEGLDAVSAGLASVERATIAAMSPYDRQLREIRARQAEIATELRRRERAARTAERQTVRQRAKSGALPSLAEALESAPSPLPAERPLGEGRAFLATRGEVGFGYPTRPGTLALTDGRQVRTVTTWGEARGLFEQGWEPGTPGLTGVRVHR